MKTDPYAGVRGLLGIGAAICVVGCASQKPAPPRPASEPCDGEAVLVIDNRSGYDLDVVEARSSGGGRSVIATVADGRHEILVRREGGYYYFTSRARRGRTEASESMSSSAGDRVQMQRECRSS